MMRFFSPLGHHFSLLFVLAAIFFAGCSSSLDDPRLDGAYRSSSRKPLWVANADGTERRELFCDPEYSQCGAPSYSLKGDKIAVECWKKAAGFRHAHIFVINSDGTAPKDLGRGAVPSWSPDGTQLAFHSFDEPGGIWLMGADGSNRKRLCDGVCPRWSPTGEWIALTRRLDAGISLILADPKTGKEVVVSEGNFNAIRPGMAWSPQGDRLCIAASTPGSRDWELLTVRAQPAGNIQTLDTNSKIDSFVSWSRDGKKVLYSATTPNGIQKLTSYSFGPAAGSSSGKVAILSGQVTAGASAISPDGKQVLFCYKAR